MGTVKELSKGKAVLVVILAIATMVVAQTAAILIGEVIIGVGGHMAVANGIVAVLYAVFALLGAKFICRLTKKKMTDFKINKVNIKPIWAVTAVIMPLIVLGLSLIVGGEWKVNSFTSGEYANLFSTIVLFLGVAVGIVEETVFRGLIMGAVEKVSNKWVAIIVPSVLFGLIHITNGFSVLSCIQLVVAGTVVGILFSLVTYESGSIWSSVLIHAVWNMSTGVLKIGTQVDESVPYNYLLNSDSFLLTGGDFGIEASIFSIIAYSIFIVVAIFLLKRKSENK